MNFTITRVTKGVVAVLILINLYILSNLTLQNFLGRYHIFNPLSFSSGELISFLIPSSWLLILAIVSFLGLQEYSFAKSAMKKMGFWKLFFECIITLVIVTIIVEIAVFLFASGEEGWLLFYFVPTFVFGIPLSLIIILVAYTKVNKSITSI